MQGSSPPDLSPPPTPPKQRKRRPDPFRDLASTPIPSPLASPASTASFASQGESDESALTKLVLTPLLCASFIVSLFLVDRRNRAYRVAEHPPSRSSSWWAYLSPRQWLDPQPYRNPTDSTWHGASTRRSDSAIAGVDGRTDRKQAGSQWFIGKMHRKVARLELSEAFEMRGRVMVALGVAWALGILALLWSATRLAQVVW